MLELWNFNNELIVPEIIFVLNISISISLNIY
jgi:hypothetical protein